MYDGIKILDLSVLADMLLHNDRLLFPLPVDEQTAAVLNHPRRATDRGLTFTLIPTKAGDKVRCELQGSLHRYGRGGVHNADDFTATDLLQTLDELVRTYAINPFCSRLNNVEFGVNVVLPFPVSQVLDNLVMYKYRPFVRIQGNDFPYYQCQTQRYVVKLYDKGHQYGLDASVLRVEVKVLKMEYLRSKGIRLDWLADLLNVANYGTLGALLVEVFTEILFDDPTIKPGSLTNRQREIYQNGRNPRFWSIPDNTQEQVRPRLWKQQQRAEKAFRALLDQHRTGANWQAQIALLIGETWQRLTTVDDDLLTKIDEVQTAWANLRKPQILPPLKRELNGYLSADSTCETSKKCPLLTGVADDCERGEMSTFNPLSVALKVDNNHGQSIDLNTSRGTPTHLAGRHVEKKKEPVRLTGSAALSDEPPHTARPMTTSPRANKDFFYINTRIATRPTATMLRADAGLLAKVQQGRKQYAKGSKEDGPTRAAHNLRNDESNPRNNLARRLRRLLNSPGLFPSAEVVKLTPEQRAALDHWQGTPYEIRL